MSEKAGGMERFCLGATIMERHRQAQPKRIVAVKSDGVWAENERGQQHFIRTRTLRRFDVLGGSVSAREERER